MKNVLELLNESNILACFSYGSHVYKTSTDKSDNDLICIVKDILIPHEIETYADVTKYNVRDFQLMVENHDVSALECLWIDNEHILKFDNELLLKLRQSFKLDKSKLRKSFSHKSSNSYVKSKKKFLLGEDFAPYVAQKSYWHSLRILAFGIQIAESGQIYNYSEMNDIFFDILNMNSFEEIDTKYRSLYKSLHSKFKLLAPL